MVYVGVKVVDLGCVVFGYVDDGNGVVGVVCEGFDIDGVGVVVVVG